MITSITADEEQPTPSTAVTVYCPENCGVIVCPDKVSGPDQSYVTNPESAVIVSGSSLHISMEAPSLMVTSTVQASDDALVKMQPNSVKSSVFFKMSIEFRVKNTAEKHAVQIHEGENAYST